MNFSKSKGGTKPSESHNNTKAPMTKRVPGGKPNAKVVAKTPPTVC